MRPKAEVTSSQPIRARNSPGVSAGASGPVAEVYTDLIARRKDKYLSHMDQRLSQVPYLAGDAFTCADIMVTFCVTSLSHFSGTAIADRPHIVDYVQRIQQRPAYVKAICAPCSARWRIGTFQLGSARPSSSKSKVTETPRS